MTLIVSYSYLYILLYLTILSLLLQYHAGYVSTISEYVRKRSLNLF